MNVCLLALLQSPNIARFYFGGASPRLSPHVLCLRDDNFRRELDYFVEDLDTLALSSPHDNDDAPH